MFMVNLLFLLQLQEVHYHNNFCTAVPSLFRWTKQPSPSFDSRVERAALINVKRCRLSETLMNEEGILVVSKVEMNMDTVEEVDEDS